MTHKSASRLATTLAMAALLTLPLAGTLTACGDDDDADHHHECDPACTGTEICQHGGACGNPCNTAVDPTVCETYDPDGEVLFCHDHEGICEPSGEACTYDNTADCGSFQICQLYIEGGSCASPCQSVGGDSFCAKIDPTFLCHMNAAGGLCAPACTDAGGSTVCDQLPGIATTCDATSGLCDALTP
jgi:hypothetical protein